MSQERTEAVVLRGVDFSETSRIVTLLTPARGRMACMAAGARRTKSPLSAVLDTFNRVEIVYYWKESRSVQKLGETTLLDGYSGVKRDLKKSAYAAFPLELAYKVAQENEPSQALYSTLVTGLEGMAAWGDDPRTHAAWQVFHLLRVAGYAPVVECVGSPTGFSYAYGVTNRPADRRLGQAECRALRAMAESRDVCPRIENAGEVFGLLKGFAARHVETEFRSLYVIEQLFAET